MNKFEPCYDDLTNEIQLNLIICLHLTTSHNGSSIDFPWLSCEP